VGAGPIPSLGSHTLDLVSRPTECPPDIALTFGVELASLDQLERLLPWAWKAERLSTALEA